MQQSNGLRFDVYERVHLPVDVADIHELEEIELTPYIQVVNQGEQVLLRGNLLLGGVYVSQGETRETRSLEHWIPVEITLPANRVSSLEALSVEVDNFDVDLLSARTLNITGVLSLKGVEARDTSPAPAYAWGEEPFTVVHRRDRSAEAEDPSDGGSDAEIRAYDVAADAEAASRAESAQEALVPADARAAEPNEPEDDEDDASVDSAGTAEARRGDASYASASSGRTGGFYAAAPQAESEPESAVSASEPVKWSGFAFFANESRDEAVREAEAEPEADAPSAETSAANRSTDLEEPGMSAETAASGSAVTREPAEPDAREPEYEADEAEAAAVGTAADDGEGEAAAVAAVPTTAEPAPVEEPAIAKPELKVAVTAKRLPETPAKTEAQGLSKLLFTNRPEPEHRWNPDAKQAKQQAVQETRSAAPAEEIEWKSLFLGGSQEEQFRKVRMCIVQRDDTLDSIAGRYQLNPREIVLYNRLSDQSVSEGQVLMIP